MKARLALPLVVLLTVVTPSFNVSQARATGDPMRYVGSVVPIENGTYGTVVVNATLGVAYLGSLDANHGVFVIDMRDRENPVLATELPPPPPNDLNNKSTSYDVDLRGRYLLVAHHKEFGLSAFSGVSVYDIAADPFHPTFLRRIAIVSCGLESAELDPEVESGRPYAYCNSHCYTNGGVYVVNILTGDILSHYVSPEPAICCGDEENLPHESFVQRHPVSGRMLDYIGYWNSGLRILDVTDPATPVEVGSFDYGPGTPYRNAHGAVATPSGDWIYVGDELGNDDTGGVHLLDGQGCDGTQYCTPTQVGFWHVKGHTTQFPDFHGFPTYFRFDVHNMNPRGENTLLLGNYSLGVRLLDVTTKSDPEQISFYMPTSGPDVTARQLYAGRRTYMALFGSDGLVYASDINYGFFILALNEHTVLPPGAARIELDRTGRLNVRVATSAGSHTFAFSTQQSGRVSLGVFDVAGRRIHSTTRDLAAGGHSIAWEGRLASGERAPSGIYFAQLQTPDGRIESKLVHLAP
jgi:hypothetical protein